MTLKYLEVPSPLKGPGKVASLIFSRNSTQAAGPTVKLHGQGGVRTGLSPPVLPILTFQSGAQKQFDQRHILRLDHWTLQVSAVPSSHLRRQLYLSLPMATCLAKESVFPSIPRMVWWVTRGQPTGTWHVAQALVMLNWAWGRESSQLLELEVEAVHHRTFLENFLGWWEMFYFPFRDWWFTSAYAKHQTGMLPKISHSTEHKIDLNYKKKEKIITIIFTVAKNFTRKFSPAL